MVNSNKQFMSGADVVVEAARDAGAEMMYGYPITPTTDIFTGWINDGQKYLQTEDEIAAGFAVCGSVMAGQRSFTATAGPGHVLMQDAISMAEAMRLPFVGIIGQRGGPSSGTVIYSQQELTLACFGGNGEGHRLVYAPASLPELYTLTRRAFNDAWKYRFPTFLLTDGYLLKAWGVFEKPVTEIENVPTHTLVNEGDVKHWRNIYTFEEELNEVLQVQQKDFASMSDFAEAEEVDMEGAEILVMAYGIVAGSAKSAVAELRAQGKKVGLFRPITMRPFPAKRLNEIAGRVKKIVVIESSFGQFASLIREELAPEIATPFAYLQKPAVGIEPEEIINFIESKV